MSNNKNIKTARKNAVHYVDNAKLYEELKAYIQEYNKCEEANEPKPPMPEYIGEAILAIANKLSNSPNFINYPFKEDMVSDGIENSLQYLRNFNYEKYTNPFSYFTQIIWYAFLRKIAKEKKQLYVKYKSIQNKIIDHEEDLVQLQKYGSEYADGNMNDFIDTFEKTNKLVKEKKPKKPKKLKGIYLLSSILDNE